MVDVTVTPAEVLPGTGIAYQHGLFGATVLGGEVVYADSTDGGDFKLADTDVDAATSLAVGIAMHGGADKQPCRLAIGGDIDPGFTVVVGEIYVLSGAAGKIAPVADLASNDFTFIIGMGRTTSALMLIMKTAGVQK